MLSNDAFAAPGLLGLALLRHQSVGPARLQWAGALASMVLAALGSTYYHLSPDTPRLAWDRDGTVLTFSLVLAAVLAERRAARAAALPVLMTLGLASVVYWQISEMQPGMQGDLRWYLLFQGGAFAAAAYVTLHCPTPAAAAAAPSTRWLVRSLALYTMAMACDRLDSPLYWATLKTVSGHTLKHILVGAGCWQLVCMLHERSS